MEQSQFIAEALSNEENGTAQVQRMVGGTAAHNWCKMVHRLDKDAPAPKSGESLSLPVVVMLRDKSIEVSGGRLCTLRQLYETSFG